MDLNLWLQFNYFLDVFILSDSDWKIWDWEYDGIVLRTIVNDFGAILTI